MMFGAKMAREMTIGDTGVEKCLLTAGGNENMSDRIGLFLSSFFLSFFLTFMDERDRCIFMPIGRALSLSNAAVSRLIELSETCEHDDGDTAEKREISPKRSHVKNLTVKESVGSLLTHSLTYFKTGRLRVLASFSSARTNLRKERPTAMTPATFNARLFASNSTPKLRFRISRNADFFFILFRAAVRTFGE